MPTYPTYYNRQGAQIDISEWIPLFGDYKYKLVAKDEAGDYSVSTVWLGLNHNYWDDGPPHIFETMLFGEGERNEECHRYSTEEEALAGHEAIVRALDNTADLNKKQIESS